MAIDECISEQGPVISSLILGVLFVASEIFPYIKSMEGNGVIQEILVIIKKVLMKKQNNVPPDEDMV